MKTNLNFEHEDTKKLLAKLNFDFFLKQNIEEAKYHQNDINTIYESYAANVLQIKIKAKSNKKQFFYYSEGQVRKMFTGGLLPIIFELDDSRGYKIFNFSEIGFNWSYFNYWQKYYNKKITKEKIWNVIVRTGGILAILLSLLKLLEYIIA